MAPGCGDPLAPWLAERCGVALARRTPVGGGCIHRAWCLELEGGARLFAKTNRVAALPLLETEAEGLAALAAAADPDQLVIPLPLALGVTQDQAVLVLPWLELGGPAALRRAAGRGWGDLGAGLAGLHRASLATACEGFGWHRDNFIGAGPQANGWHGHWGTFFAERRLRPQLERLAAGTNPLRGAQALLEQVPAWLEGHGAEPCLVHGDLWSGNAALTASGIGALFDPAVHRGDREVDLALARLFGGFPEVFFAGYERVWPLPAGHRGRVDLYNLYHLLNHANLFGGGYRQQAQAAIDRLLSSPMAGW